LRCDHGNVISSSPLVRHTMGIAFPPATTTNDMREEFLTYRQIFSTPS